MIKTETIRIPLNYVLIKMDDKHETYQMKGRETGILSPQVIHDNGKQVDVRERHVSNFGIVVKTPERLCFNARKIKELSDRHKPIREVGEKNDMGERRKVIVNQSALDEIKTLKSTSVDYDSEIEIRKGDRVHVSYIYYLNAERQGLFIYDTDMGDLVMIRYDFLRMVVDKENKPIKMLNGLILIKPKKEINDIKTENGVKIVERESGIALITNTETKRTRKNQKGSVILCGKPIKGYMHAPNLTDPETRYEKGDELLYDPRLATKLENSLHQIISEEDLYMIRREAILADSNVFPNFDLLELR